jgi:hypothetical protein
MTMPKVIRTYLIAYTFHGPGGAGQGGPSWSLT